jgi:transmembrane sensor
MDDKDISRLINDDSFVNFCFSRNADDVLYWETWLLANPEYACQIEELRSKSILLAYHSKSKEADSQYALLQRRIALRNGQPKKEKGFLLFTKVAVAACLLLTIGAGIFFYQNNRHVNSSIAYTNYIAPGGSSATLTLADGSKIKLSGTPEGELVKEAGVIIAKTADGELMYGGAATKGGDRATTRYNTLSTEKAEQYRVRLPDGSMVYLNSASSITYPSSFAGLSKRKIELSGEAFFEVAKDKKHPFVVRTSRQEVEALGTHFNVNSYSDEPVTRTTLIEGAVKITTNSGQQFLKPGQEATTKKSGFLITNVNPQEAAAWKNGTFNFNNQNIKEVMREISRWYNVEVEFAGAVSNEGFNAALSRSKNISQILKVLESTGAVHFKIEGRKIIVINNYEPKL